MRFLTNNSSNNALYRGLALSAVSIVLWWRPIDDTLTLALSSDAHTHILLILPLSLALAYLQSRRVQPASEFGGWIGLAVLAVSLFLRGLAAWNIFHLSASGELTLDMFALVIWWIGSVIFSFGRQTFTLQVFPLCFLFLIVPLPISAVNWITEVLQHQSTDASTALFRAAHVPVQQHGILIDVPGIEIKVARECSSIRSSTMLVVTTLILAQLFLRSWWRKILLVAVAIPLSVAKNAIRIFVITMLATRVNPDFFQGRLHRQGGVLFLGLAIAVIVALLWPLRRTELRDQL